jgi:hypothetical protein
LLYNLARLKRNNSPEIESHYDIQPVIDIFASPDQRDLGRPRGGHRADHRQNAPTLPRGTTIELRGQVDTMRTSFTRLGLGMIFAVVLVYLVMAVNFQSWLDPFIILMALPGAMAGMLWMLYLTHTTLSVPALMGAIMGIGVATANSILLVTFANDERALGKSAVESALSAGFTRIRPVTMTALAMIIGMLPMAFALGEGGEQNAPLGRAVIGGTLVRDAHHAVLRADYLHLLRKKAPVDMDRQIAIEAGEIPQAMSDKEAESRAFPFRKLAVFAIQARPPPFIFLGYLPRERTTKETRRRRGIRRITPPLVNAASKARGPEHQLLLPGTCHADHGSVHFRPRRRLSEAALCRYRRSRALPARSWPISRRRISINRYLRRRLRWRKPRGSSARPQALLEQLTATRDLAEITWQRYKILTDDGAVSRQDGDNQSTAAKTSEANVVAQQKTVRRQRSSFAPARRPWTGY